MRVPAWTLWLRSLVERLRAPTAALPLDLFRVLVGLLALGYCLRLCADAPAFFADTGLLDHAQSRAAFWFTYQPLFWPSMTAAAARAILLAGAALALALTLGLWPRRCAALLYLIVVCAYRFNFLVLYVDDAVVHLLLLWTALLPVGRTLTLRGLRQRHGWPAVQVPGTGARLLLGNLACLYAVAGLTKLTSPLWRAGYGVYAALKIPAGWFADALSPAQLPLTVAANHATLALEPLFAVLVCLPAGRLPRLRGALGASLLLFHLGITLTMDVPFANLGCLCALPLLFRGEITRWLGAPVQASLPAPRLQPGEAAAALLLFLLVGAALGSAAQADWRGALRSGAAAPGERRLSAEAGGPVQSAFFSALWVLGLAQQYRLLDWIDQRNWHFTLRIEEERAGGRRALPGSALVPRGMRGSLTMTYLLGITWMPVPAQALPALRQALHERLARRHCRLQRGRGAARVTLHATLTRVDPRRPTAAEPLVLSRFRCADDGALRALDATYQPGP